MTVDCIDWNSVVDLSSHPLGPPTSLEDQSQINVVIQVILNIVSKMKIDSFLEFGDRRGSERFFQERLLW